FLAPLGTTGWRPAPNRTAALLVGHGVIGPDLSGPLSRPRLEWWAMSKSGLELAPGPGGDPVQSALSYLVALSSTAAALLLSLGLEARFGSSSFALLFAAVMLSAWYGGLGPGLLSTVIGGLAADYYLEFPLYSLRLASPQTALRLGLFVLVALFISSLSARLRTARAVAEGARREAQ